MSVYTTIGPLVLVIFQFGSEGVIWVLFAPAPGHCILDTFSCKHVPCIVSTSHTTSQEST